MRILFVANKDITLFFYIKEFIESLIDQQHEVFILCPYGDKLDYFINIGCKHIDYKIERRGINPLKELCIVKKFFKEINKIKPNFIYTYTIKPNIYVGLISRFKKIKYIPTITGLGSVFYKSRMTTFLLKLLYKFSFKKPYIVFFQNSENKSWFEKNINNKCRSRLVNGSGVNISKYGYIDLRKSNTTVFLFLGRIMREKGINEFLEASKLIKDKYNSSVNIKVAGFYEEDYKEILKEYVSKGIIEYLGFVENTVQLIADSTVVVLPSYHEGLSNVLLEAQAIGRPVIASNIPGCIETFINKKSGLAIQPQNSIDLFYKVEKIHLMDINEKREMGIIGRKHVVENFNRDHIVKKYNEIIYE